MSWPSRASNTALLIILYMERKRGTFRKVQSELERMICLQEVAAESGLCTRPEFIATQLGRILVLLKESIEDARIEKQNLKKDISRLQKTLSKIQKRASEQ